MSSTPKRPYLIRALHQWIEDNSKTPYMLIDANYPGVEVPAEHVKKGQIVLNFSSSATGNLVIDNDYVVFEARFGGVSRRLFLPMGSITAVFAKETSDGMMFEKEDFGEAAQSQASVDETQPNGSVTRTHSAFKVIK